MSTFFGDLQKKEPDAVFHITTMYNQERDDKKVNLGVGAYRDENNNPWVLPIVRDVEKEMANNESLNHEYLPISGLQSFCDSATELMLGSESKATVNNRVSSIQCLSGTGSIRLAAAFFKRVLPDSFIYVSSPTWGNHSNIFTNESREARIEDWNKKIKQYPYINRDTYGLDFEGMINALKEAPERSIIVLHACAHNPTGVDPTQEQWKAIAAVVQERNLFPLFDAAYQGFATGDPDTDAWSVRYFADLGIEFFIAQSFAKNFGLYNERAGNLIVVAKNGEQAEIVLTHLKALARPMWSNPPNHGARIVSIILNNYEYRQRWRENLKTMANRILKMRELLFQKLRALGTPGNWTHIINQRGMFSFTGLKEKQVEYLMKTKHIFLLKSGRINLCGLNHSNIDYVAEAIDDVVRNISS